MALKNIIIIYISGLISIGFLLIVNTNLDAQIFVLVSMLSAIITSLSILTIPKSRKIQKSSFTYVSYQVNTILLISIFIPVLSVYFLISDFSVEWTSIMIELERNPLLRFTILISYFIVLASPKNTLILRIISILYCLTVILFLRNKLFMVPFIFVFIADIRNSISFGRIALILIGGYTGYVGVAIFRWYGSLKELSLSKFATTYENVTNAGIESELVGQFNAVFNYYLSHPKILGDSYVRLLTYVPGKIFGWNIPDNPMYLYYTIWNNNVIVKGGSAHPTIFGDSFANFGWFGFVVPSMMIYMIFVMYQLFERHRTFGIVALTMFTALNLRGSVYFSLFYLTLIYFIYLLITHIYGFFGYRSAS